MFPQSVLGAAAMGQLLAAAFMKGRLQCIAAAFSRARVEGAVDPLHGLRNAAGRNCARLHRVNPRGKGGAHDRYRLKENGDGESKFSWAHAQCCMSGSAAAVAHVLCCMSGWTAVIYTHERYTAATALSLCALRVA